MQKQIIQLTFAHENRQNSQILQSVRDGYPRLATPEPILNLGAQMIW